MRSNIFRNLEVKKTESPSWPLEGAQKAVSFKDFTQIMTNTRLYTGTTEQLVWIVAFLSLIKTVSPLWDMYICLCS